MEPRAPKADDVGKLILVGVTYVDAADQVLRAAQYVGVVAEASESQIVVAWEDGTRTSLPPEVADAPPGSYRLRRSGRVVDNPDLLMKWRFSPGDVGDYPHFPGDAPASE